MQTKKIMFLFIVILLIALGSNLSAVVVIDYLYNVTDHWTIDDSVYVTSGGIIQNSGGNFSLTINGGLENHGIIRNNPGGYSLNLGVSGNIRNYGEWSCYKTELNGALNIHSGAGNHFTSTYFENHTSGTIYARTDLSFINCNINFQNNGVFDLSEGWDISVDGGYIYQTTIIGEPVSGSELYMSNGANLQTVTASSMIFSGIVDIADVYVTITNFLINNGYLQNSGNNHTLTMNGDLTNNGTIRNNPGGYGLYLDITGDITNSGVWANADIELTGTTSQHIICSPSYSFSVGNFLGNDSRATNYFDSDITFSGSNVDLNGDTFELQSGMTYTQSGGYLYNGTLTGTSATFDLSAGNNFQTITLDIDTINLNGTCQIANGAVYFIGSIYNFGTLQTNPSNQALYITGDITNNGAIRNNPSGHGLYLDITGDITNSGVWSNADIDLTGSTSQHIICSPSYSFDVTNFYGNNSGFTNYFGSDITFNGTNVNLEGDTFELQTGMVYTQSGGYLYYGTMTGAIATFDLSAGNNFQTITLDIDTINLNGTCQIANGAVYFIGSIYNYGTIQNNPSNQPLYITGDITNNGTIRNNPAGYSMYLDVTGDIHNNGNWTNADIELTGTTEQHITCAPDSSFAIPAFYGNNTRATNYFDTDITFIGTSINLRGDNFILASGMTFEQNGGYLINGTLTGDDAILNMHSGNYTYSVTYDIDQIELYGILQIADEGVSITGDLTNNGYLQNYSSNHNLFINGDLTNNATIRDNPGSYSLFLHISGDIMNYGSWTNHSLSLTGAGQYIVSGNGNIFEIDYFYGNNSARGNIIFDSDIAFIGTNIYLYSDELVMDNSELSLNGCIIHHGTLSGTEATLDLTGGSYIYSLTLNFSELNLTGTCQIADNGVTMAGTVNNYGYIQNYSSNHDLYMNAALYNYGTIRDNPGSYSLFLHSSNDIYNYGIFTNNRIVITGAGQNLFCDNGHSFDVDLFYGNSSSRSDINMISDITFNGTTLDLNSDNLNLYSGTTLSLNGGYLYEGSISGTDATLNTTGGNYIYSLTSNVSDLTLTGTCQIADNGVSVNGNIINNGILQNIYANHTLILNGDFTNNGTVRNHPSSYVLYAHLRQDVTNNGDWTNSISYIDGTTDQTISINSGNEITGDMRFVSDVTGSPYNWMFNTSPIDAANPDFLSETTAQLNWEVPVASGYWGTFDCLANGQESRDIIVVETGAAPAAPVNLTIDIISGDVNLSWDAVAGATSYTVYSDTDPEGGFSTVKYNGASNSCSFPITEIKEFYRVTALN